MIIPDQRLVRFLLAFLALSILLALARIFGFAEGFLSLLFQIGAASLFLAALYDWYVSRERLSVSCNRLISSSFALGAQASIRLNFENPLSEAVSIRLVDSVSDKLVSDSFPLDIELSPGAETAVDYEVLPVKRGEAYFQGVSLRIQSRFKLWRYRATVAEPQSVKVYPNFMAVSKLNFLVYEQQLNHIGAHAMQRRGLGLDFKQLREFQRGDELRQVDWKASARQHKMISREYQDERDQDIVFLLDTGRRMRASDSLYSHFDHCINAMLLTSYIALMAGDAVGFMSYAGTDRWLRPVKGKSSINSLLNNLYDLHSTADASDLLKAAESLMLRHSKRSLIVVVTNIRDEDSADVVQAFRLLSKKHLVMVACLRETVLDQPALAENADFDASLDYSGVRLYMQQRQKMIKTLQHNGVICVDSTAEKMHVALINQYMALKRAGRI